MNLKEVSGLLHVLAFRAARAVLGLIPGGRIEAFGEGSHKIGAILVLNLDRQPRRLQRTLREFRRFRTDEGKPLAAIVQRIAAIEARNGREIAATADVDPNYRLGDQLFVQPDAVLAECFGVDEPVTMTRQEIAVARSHIEAWKTIAVGGDEHVLVVEDDIWFVPGAAAAIDAGWRAAIRRCAETGGPRLLYLSYSDAGGTAARADICDALFRPERGLWFLSGYVLSRQGAQRLLSAMPVTGPVDMWMNYRFGELAALALSSPAIMQRPDGGSDNSYSVLPYLARAGIVDANAVDVPGRTATGRVIAWTAQGERDSLAMAMSILGLRVRAFDGDEPAIGTKDLTELLETWDALVDPPLSQAAFSDACAIPDIKFLREPQASAGFGSDPSSLPSSRIAVLPAVEMDSASWQPICDLLGLNEPAEAFPRGPMRQWRAFRDDRAMGEASAPVSISPTSLVDNSPWVLPPRTDWPVPPSQSASKPPLGHPLIHAPMTAATPLLPAQVQTFPGNLATFARDGLIHRSTGAELVLSKAFAAARPYQSGAFASVRSFTHGRFEAEIRAARGAGLVTGFFLHRHAPRQEIDIELTGDDPFRMLVNVYFNPGDSGAAMSYGYRGTPCRIELGFDASQDFHQYSIEWRPGCISWSVDSILVHQRVGWDPTPIPHLPMRLHANLWAPRSKDLAGRIDERALPSTAVFRNVSIWA